MSIVLLGGAEDPQIRRVSDALEARGAAFRLLDTARFPGQDGLALGPDGVTFRGRTLAPPRAVYVRGLACHPLMPGVAALFESHPRRVLSAMEEKRALLESMLLVWEAQGAKLFNSPEANAQHSRKPYQLSLLHQAGLPVPRWLATNDGDRLRSQIEAWKRAVYKPLAGGATVRQVLPEDLSDERIEQLAAAPVLFQEYVQGVSVRAYVAGEQVAGAAEIHSEELDYRRAEGAVTPTRLSSAETAMALCAARACGMRFTGVDFIRSADGTWLLECNPSPMFAVFEDKTGCEISGALAELLAAE